MAKTTLSFNVQANAHYQFCYDKTGLFYRNKGIRYYFNPHVTCDLNEIQDIIVSVIKITGSIQGPLLYTPLTIIKYMAKHRIAKNKQRYYFRDRSYVDLMISMQTQKEFKRVVIKKKK